MKSKTIFILFSVFILFISCALIAYLLNLWSPQPFLFWLTFSAIVGGYKLKTLCQWKPFIPEHRLYSLTYPYWWLIKRRERYRIFFSPFFSNRKIEVQILTKSNAKIPGSIANRLGTMEKGHKKFGSRIRQHEDFTILTYHQDSHSIDTLGQDPYPVRTNYWYVGGPKSIVVVSYQAPQNYFSQRLARTEIDAVKKVVDSIRIY